MTSEYTVCIYIYIYIYIKREREREREREMDMESFCSITVLQQLNDTHLHTYFLKREIVYVCVYEVAM